MNTRCEIHLVSENKIKADTVASEVLKEVKRLEKKYNYYNLTSYLSQINNRNENVLDIETKDILKNCLNYYDITNKVFDVTIATIKDIFKSDTLKEFYSKKEFLTPFVGCENFKIQRTKIVFSNPHTKIDLGGYVKEYAVDRSVNILKKHKIKSAFINYGGDMYILGLKPDGSKYKIGIKNPKFPKNNIISLELYNQAIATSGGYERSYMIEDKIFSHIIASDVQNEYLSATVISNSSLTSGIYSTSLMINSDIKTKEKIILVDKNLELSYRN
ncbi:MAG: Thiamin biosynthesis lipoprotein ApbE [uncultured Campylobacterales bacterium]|uniref:FAD:protein FMN transferase n=1 Tax=uncultured Campylobacterales bacterium TaxID=352960 RepID=A0A6S6T9X1_9BACT|nr:MAG: Thiamin biosynthesis lipoprotein ApbE [uncultured Campylobacterales bacterium]